jgi:DNA-binding response OmpR family regulator
MDQHTVLVVEDEFFIREDACAHLEERGFNVLKAASADEALNTLLARADVDLVFTDVRMPGSMDGLQLARWVLDHRPNIAVIIASGDAGRVVAMRDLYGAHAFTKPYSFDEVVTKMLHLIQSRRSANQ